MRKHSIEYIAKLITESGVANTEDQLITLVHDRIKDEIQEATEEERWDDPGVYPSGAGGGPLASRTYLNIPTGDQEFKINVPPEVIPIFQQIIKEAWDYINSEAVKSGNTMIKLGPQDVDDILYGHVTLYGNEESYDVLYYIKEIFQESDGIYTTVFVEEP